VRPPCQPITFRLWRPLLDILYRFRRPDLNTTFANPGTRKALNAVETRHRNKLPAWASAWFSHKGWPSVSFSEDRLASPAVPWPALLNRGANAMWQDLRQAARMLRRQPAFLCVTSLVLALAIGINVTIFSLLYAIVFEPLPVASSDRLVSIYQVFARQPDRPAVLNRLQYEFLKSGNEVFDDITGHFGLPYTLDAGHDTSLVNAEVVLSNYFSLLGVRPLLGRTLLPAEDDTANPERAAVISHALWTRLFHSDRTIIGRPIRVTAPNGFELTATVVGVMGPEFKGIAAPWAPTQLWMTIAQGHERPERGFAVAAIGRLKPGVRFEQAQAVVEAQGRQLYYARPTARPEHETRFVAYPTNDVRVPSDPAAAVIPTRLAASLTIVVAVALLVAAVNVAGLLLARGVARAGELATRRALGATPARVVRQLFAEALVLSLVGSCLAVVVAAWMLSAFSALTPLRFAVDVSINARIVLFATAVGLVTGVLVAIMPARQATSFDLLPWLANGGSMEIRPLGRRLRHVLTVSQIALSLMLVLLASLHVRGLLRVELSDTGYDAHGLLVATSALRVRPGASDQPERQAERSRNFYDQLWLRLRAIPLARASAIADSLPLREPAERPNWSVVTQEGYLGGARHGAAAERSAVSPEFFRTMGMSLTAGRDFDERDSRRSQKVAVVSVSLARQLWPTADALGRTLTVVNEWTPDQKAEWYEVIGVVSDVRPVLHERSVRPFIYLAMAQSPSPSSTFILVRDTTSPQATAPAIKNAVANADGSADVRGIQTMGQMIGEILYPRRVAAIVLGVSAILALLLAVTGVYSTVSYSVAQRSKEIGLRMALGASGGDVIRLVLREGGLVGVAGCASGILFAWLAIRLISARYLALPRIDATTFLVVPVLLGAVVLLACYVPARRAARLPPLDVLRRS
jgi:putative ABC transport system permease protein